MALGSKCTDIGFLSKKLKMEEPSTSSVASNLLAANPSSDAAATAPFEKKSRSCVWKYFRRHQNKADCLLCNKPLAYNGGTTSNLIAHLERKHPSSIKAEVEGSRDATRQLSIRDYGKVQPRGSKACSIDVQREITRILSRWPWLDMRPIAIVRDRGLKELLNFLEPNYQVPSTTHVSTLIRKTFEDGKAALTARLSGASSVALTTDIWTSKATQAFATTTAHFLDADWNLVSCVLETIHFPGSHTGIRISEQIKGSLTCYNIRPDQVSAVVHDEAANVVLAGKLLLKQRDSSLTTSPVKIVDLDGDLHLA